MKAKKNQKMKSILKKNPLPEEISKKDFSDNEKTNQISITNYKTHDNTRLNGSTLNKENVNLNLDQRVKFTLFFI